MPELPEVEVLVRSLQPLLVGRRVRSVDIRRGKVLRSTPASALEQAVVGARFIAVERRGKYILLRLSRTDRTEPITVLGHLGMTGRLYVQPSPAPLPKHTAVCLELDAGRLVFEDTRYFGRLTLDTAVLASLGPEALSSQFNAAYLHRSSQASKQSIKVRLLDQSVVAGLGNIYASEALFRARVSPQRPACHLTRAEAGAVCRAAKTVMRQAIAFGSTVPLSWSGEDAANRLFYYGAPEGQGDGYAERLQVYDRAGQPCRRCESRIRRIVQGGRSTYFCPRCQK